jgi:hypothetical protein
MSAFDHSNYQKHLFFFGRMSTGSATSSSHLAEDAGKPKLEEKKSSPNAKPAIRQFLLI